jgi:hypothetical protein
MSSFSQAIFLFLCCALLAVSVAEPSREPLIFGLARDAMQ